MDFCNTILLVFITFKTALCCRQAESCLIEDVLADYNPLARPVVNHSTTTNLTLTYVLHSLKDIEGKSQTMQTLGSFVANWRDEMLQWEPQDYEDIKTILLPAETVWLPNLYIKNGATEFFSSSFKEDFHAAVSYTGDVQWTYGGIIETLCELEILHFPFDTQSCHIAIGSWALPKTELDMTAYLHKPDNYQPNSVWRLDDQHILNKYMAFNTNSCSPCEYAFSIFRFKWSRLPRYHVLTVVMPAVLVTLIALCTFWLPAESGEKASLGITVLLAFTVLQLVINEHTPVTSVITPYLSQMIIIAAMLQTASLLGGIISIHLAHKESPDRVPKFIRVIAFRFFAKVFGMEKIVPQEYVSSNEVLKAEEACNGDNQTHETSEDNTYTTDHMTSILNEMRFITQQIKEKEKENLISSEWKLLGKLFDRLLFYICLCLFSLTMLSVFI